VVATDGHVSNPQTVKVAVPIAENLHPVTNPAIDAEGNIYVTFSGSRGQKVPVSIFKIDTDYNVKPFVSEMMNPTSIALDREGQIYVSSRFDGAVYRVAQNGTMTTYAEGMGVATGIAFDREESLYVGDRNGKPLSGRCAVWVKQYGCAFDDVGLFGIVGRHLPAAVGKALLQFGDDLGIAPKADSQCFGNGFAGEVVFRRAQAAAEDENVTPEKAMLGGGDKVSEVVTNYALKNYIDPEQVELFGQVERVGVDAMGSEHLGTHRDNFSVHALRV
jgi:hypothetical protein